LTARPPLSSSIGNPRAATRIGGWSLVAAAAGFIGVFTYLAVRFNYPDVLDGDAADVLPRLFALGGTGRAVWAFYACLPLLLIPAGIGAHAALRHAAPNAMNAALVFAAIAAVSMLLGLARWPSVHWELARTYGTAAPAARSAIDSVFAGLNVYLGNYIGEFTGELALNAFFVLTGFAALRSAQVGRWFGVAGIAVGVAGWIGAFRNATTVVDPIAEVNNYLLPVWLIVLGVVCIRWKGGTPAADSPAGARFGETS
jgi:hypothetical protein